MACRLPLRWCGARGLAGIAAAWLGPLGGRATAASLPAFLEGSEDTGAHPRPGSLAARGTARGLLRAGQSCLAWPGACLRPGLWGGGALHHPGAQLGACLCWSSELPELRASPASPVRTHRALRPGRGLVGPGGAGAVALSPGFVALPTAPAPRPSVAQEWVVEDGQASVQVPLASDSLLPQGGD